MNLKEVLNYRNRCLMCYSKMELKSYDLAGINIVKVQDGLLIETGLKGVAVKFKYDGTYEKLKRWNNLYVKPMTLFKECPKCIPNIKVDSPKVVYKPRSVGATTLDQFTREMKDLRCAYTMVLFGDAEGNFSSNLGWEEIKYNNGADFYYLKTWHDSNKSEIQIGNFFKTNLNNMMKLSVPAVKASSLQTTNDFISKLKMYTLFS